MQKRMMRILGAAAAAGIAMAALGVTGSAAATGGAAATGSLAATGSPAAASSPAATGGPAAAGNGTAATGAAPVSVVRLPAATAYVANARSDTVTPIDIATGARGPAIIVHGGPAQIAVTPERQDRLRGQPESRPGDPAPPAG